MGLYASSTVLLFCIFNVFDVVCAASGSLHTLSELKLSPTAQIHLRDSPGYANLTKRWQYWHAPDAAAVVEVATDSDAAETVRFATAHNIPFTTQSGGHGSISSLGEVKDGILINMRRLNTVIVSSDGTYATVGGGIKSKEVHDLLWPHNKWTVHGICDCPGLTAVSLGGGHGILQGRYGLLSDQIISLDVVLANGSAITVSDSEHKELFWAMRGAGHNYGIVTSLKYRVYDIPETEIGGKIWSYEVLMWEATVENAKKIYALAKATLDQGTQPDGLFLYGVVGLVPDVSSKPVIMQNVAWNGPLSSIRQHTQTYHDLKPIAVSSEEGTFLDIPRWLMVNDDSVPCNPSLVLPKPGLMRFPVDVKTYNLDALSTVIEKFSTFITETVEFAGSFLLIEQYPTRAMTEKKGNGMVPWRENPLLIAPALLYSTVDATTDPPTPKPHLDKVAIETGNELRQILVDGAEESGGHYSYVNYAYGGETPEELYGKENLKRLRDLKSVYDPENKFRYYAPIVTGDNEEGHSGAKTEL